MDLTDIVPGDMPGDKVNIDESHIKRADVLYPLLMNLIQESGSEKTVISIYGGSGVGKSEIGSLIAHYLKLDGLSAYVLSGDNYPHRFPEENDRERELRYESGGQEALKAYLGTEEEIEFSLINRIVERFKQGDSSIELKRMGRTAGDIRYEKIDFTDIKALVIEWTHGNNPALVGVDFPVFLYSTPEETLKHRLLRARDKNTDGDFTRLVLKIEQAKVNSQVETSSLIISKSGELLTAEYILEK